MKKLLGILGAIAFTASVSSTVVACGTSTSSSSDGKNLHDGLDWGTDGGDALVKLSDGTTVRLGDLINKNSANFDDYLLNDVNGLVADSYARDYSKNNLNGAQKLGFLDLNDTYKLQNDKSTVNAYKNEIDNYNMIASASDLYRQYVAAYIKGYTLDQQYIRDGYLNPIWYQGKSDLDGSYSLWFMKTGDTKLTRWTTISETNISKDDKTGTRESILQNDYLPTPDELNGNNFYLLNTPEMKSGQGKNKITDASSLTIATTDIKDGGKAQYVAKNISGQQALLFRYQSYVQSHSTDTMLNALVMEYAKNTLYKMQSKPATNSKTYETDKDKSLYIDTSSTIADAIQSWPTKNDDLVTSNYKMVWTLSLPKDKEDAIQGAIEGLADINPANIKLKSDDYSVIKQGTTIQNVVDAINGAVNGSSPAGGNKSLDAKVTDNNANKNGSDPYFGISGYQGIVKDGKLVSGDSLNLDSSAVDKIKSVEGLGILANGQTSSSKDDYNFTSKTDANNYDDYVIVMPLYLMDLLRNGNNSNTEISTPDADKLVNIARNQWIELNPQNADAKWSSSSKFDVPDDMKFKGTDDTLPTKTSVMNKDDKEYIFIPDSATNDDITSIKAGDAQLTITPEPTNTKDDLSGFGVKGVYENIDKSKPDSWKYNGTTLNYAIHLGEDSSSPTSYLDAWTGPQKGQDINDIAGLSNSNKEQLMDTLLAAVAKNDSSIQEETKNAIYRNYISLNDIWYKGLYDKISKYLKEDDSTDASD